MYDDIPLIYSDDLNLNNAQIETWGVMLNLFNGLSRKEI